MLHRRIAYFWLTCQWPCHCLTDRVIFFQSGFWPGSPVTIPQSHRPGFFFIFLNTFSTLNVSDHTTVSQIGFKKIRSVRPWYGHWHPGVKCLRKKNPVWQTMIWSLGFVKFVWSLMGKRNYKKKKSKTSRKIWRKGILKFGNTFRKILVKLQENLLKILSRCDMFWGNIILDEKKKAFEVS